MAKVLIVDDEVPNLELVEAIVNQEGYEAILAMDGEAALQIVHERHPDLVLMDIVMPKMNGIEACRRIKTNPLTYSIPVVIITAFNSTDERIRAVKAGADDFVSKPFDRLELTARIKSLLRLKVIHDRLEASLSALKEMQYEREKLITQTAQEEETPLAVIAECLQAVAGEQHLLSAETVQKIEPALTSVNTLMNMTADFVNIMRMEQDKLREAYESLNKHSQKPGTGE